jgi:hypothetical protein
VVQNFVLAYLCQSCKAAPEFFFVRREHLKLINVGRSPIEQVAVSVAIPKKHRKYFASATIAFQSGQVLASLFLLRTFLEQLASAHVTDQVRGDALMQAYMATLPEPVRAHFPSPREMYGKLSDAIHAADEDSQLFENVSAQIVEHFEARRLYRVATS